MNDNDEVCGQCLGNRWRIFLDEQDQPLVKACVECNPKGELSIGIKLYDTGKEDIVRSLYTHSCAVVKS